MASEAQLKACTAVLTASLKSYCRTVEATVGAEAGSAPQRPAPPSTPPSSTPPSHTSSEAHRARRSIITTVAKLQTLLFEPADFLQELARQNQLLACLQWLGEFQVLACIPLSGSAAFKDVAQVAGVPENQLCCVVRMMATAGFLHEPKPAHVAHSALSAPFVTKPSLLDGAMFLSETAAPAALQMAEATRRFGHLQRPDQSAYNVALNTPMTFASACEQRPRLQRQWPAYLRYGIGDVDTTMIDTLTCFDWDSLGNATVVNVGVRSTATAIALADLYPALHLVVQMSEPGLSRHISQQSMFNECSIPASPPGASTYCVKPCEVPLHLSSRISVQKRVPGTLQRVKRADVYILHLPSPSPTAPSHLLSARIVAELRAHIDVLCASSSASLVLTSRLLPEPGTVEPDVESNARVRDLCLLQLANERNIETKELMNMLSSASDHTGHFVLINKSRSHNSATVAFEVQYQVNADPHDI